MLDGIGLPRTSPDYPARGNWARIRGQLQGVVSASGAASRVAGGRRSSDGVEQMGASLLAYVKKNPGKRGEDIAAGLETDSKTIRLPMKKLIADGEVRTKGERRGMRYYPA